MAISSFNFGSGNNQGLFKQPWGVAVDTKGFVDVSDEVE